MKPFILGAIFARGGSKGVPGKNIKDLAGKPLIAYSIEVGLAIPLIDRLIVSTDDNEIAEIARQFNAEVPFIRPTELASDTSAEILAWQHAIREVEKEEEKKVDILVSIPTTSPFRSKEDVEACIDMLLKSDADGVVTVTSTTRSPYFNMVTINAENDAQIAIEPKEIISRRQDVPAVFDMTTVAYAFRTSFIKNTTSIMQGKIKAVIVPEERALDIDTPLDFEIAEYLMKRKVDNNEIS